MVKNQNILLALVKKIKRVDHSIAVSNWNNAGDQLLTPGIKNYLEN
jgi:hypothetical protein